MARNDLTFLSAGFREELDPETLRRTGKSDMVLRCATEKGAGRVIVIRDEAEAMRLIEQLSRTVNSRRDIERALAERRQADAQTG